MNYKIFISQPMKGKTIEEIENRRKELIDMFTFGSVEIIDTFFKDGGDKDPLICLGEAIKLMNEANLVVFDSGWEHANGCVIEHECAVRYGKKIMYL